MCVKWEEEEEEEECEWRSIDALNKEKIYPNDINEYVKGERKKSVHGILKKEDNAQSCLGRGSSISFVRAFFYEIFFITPCENVHSL